MSSLADKIIQNERGILLYGLTPPKITTPPDRAHEIAARQLDRLQNAPIDGLVIYDLQDESSRTSEARPFDFIRTYAPEIYLNEYLKNAYPAVIYKAVANYTAGDFDSFLRGFRGVSVFVGASSARDDHALKLKDAYKIAAGIKRDFGSGGGFGGGGVAGGDFSRVGDGRVAGGGVGQGGSGVAEGGKHAFYYGGIAIPERHLKKGDEHLRAAAKTAAGCDFFITQAVYDIETAKKFIDDYAGLNSRKVPLIFTFTPCGSRKTLDFMRWLGISVPVSYEERLFGATDPLAASLALDLDMFEFLYNYGLAKGVSIGANVESVSANRAEIEASIELLFSFERVIKTQTGQRGEGGIIASASKPLD